MYFQRRVFLNQVSGSWHYTNLQKLSPRKGVRITGSFGVVIKYETLVTVLMQCSREFRQYD